MYTGLGLFEYVSTEIQAHVIDNLFIRVNILHPCNCDAPVVLHTLEPWVWVIPQRYFGSFQWTPTCTLLYSMFHRFFNMLMAVYVLTHSAIRPSQQWAGPYTNGANDRPIEQWAQPIHQSVSSIIISYETM